MNANIAPVWGILEIVWINILLSGDNAVLIALACGQLPPKQRRLGAFLGALGGVALRIGFTFIVIQIMAVPLLKMVGGLLLIGVAIKLLVDDPRHAHVEAEPNFWGAVASIIAADALMSLDNVIAIAGVARGKIGCHIPFAPRASPPISKPAARWRTRKRMAAHENPRTTKLYDRTGDEITLDEVERIAI